MTWVQIDTDLFVKEVDNPIEVVSLSTLQSQKAMFENKLSLIADDVVHEDKDYEIFLNSQRQELRDVYVKRIVEISRLLNEILN